jgi:Tfp pilus assembly protein PilV
MTGWVEAIFALLVLGVGLLAVKALNDLRRQIESMKQAVESIGAALDQQHDATRRTLQAIGTSVDNTANSLGRIERAMPPTPVPRRGL